MQVIIEKYNLCKATLIIFCHICRLFSQDCLNCICIRNYVKEFTKHEEKMCAPIQFWVLNIFYVLLEVCLQIWCQKNLFDIMVQQKIRIVNISTINLSKKQEEKWCANLQSWMVIILCSIIGMPTNLVSKEVSWNIMTKYKIVVANIFTILLPKGKIC